MSTVKIDQKNGGHVGTRIGKRARTAGISILCAVALGLTACTGSGAVVDDATANSLDGGVASSIEEAVTNAMALSGSTAAIVGVWQGDESAYVQGFGEGVDANTQIRAAQASQPVMCAALLGLTADEKLTLDREVVKDIPRQVGIDEITYEQLCKATSGLGDFKPSIRNIFANNPTRQWPDRELLAHGLARSPLSWPGLDVHLADTNSLLLGRALHQKTDQSLDELLRQYVFTPAEMYSSYYPKDPLTEVEVTDGMVGYTQPFKSGEPVCDVEAVRVEQVSPSMLAGGGATVTTVNDLKSFYEHYVGGSFGTNSAELITDTVSTINPKRDENGEPLEEQEEPSDEAKAAERFWGFGLEQVDSLYGMSGAMTGTLTAAYHNPGTDFTVVVALNNSTAGASFVRNLALQLAALGGEETSVSAEDRAAALESAAVCADDSEDGEEE